MDICSQPCIVDMRRKIGAIDDKLDLLDTLKDLLEALTDGQGEPTEPPPLTFVPLTVPIITCNLDGTATTTPTEIQVLEGSQAGTLEQFRMLAAIQTKQCKIQRDTERSHNILGGNVWFENEADRAPEYSSRIEAEIISASGLFSVVDNPVEGSPPPGSPESGQLKAKSLIQLMTAYTANLYYRAGFGGLPTTVPKTLLGYTDADPPVKINDLANYFAWFVRQVDALIGNFPIKIRVEDIDPLTPGNQVKEIELPNISEALAELYGMNIGTSVNADVAVNFLMRLASEVIATKNAALITQDYSKANAAFLGYKGNPARREINYSFDPAKLGSLDEFLKESKGYLVGWKTTKKAL
jgi:hypothetical protein